MSQDPLYLLCVEPRFPGRLGSVADWLVRRRGYRCQFYCTGTSAEDQWPASVGRGLEVIRYKVGGVAREASVKWMRQLERSLCYAYGCWEELTARRPQPVDLVLGRSHGLGSTLFTPVYIPHVPIVQQFHYFQQAHAYDLAPEAEPEMPVEYFHARRAANAIELIELENGTIPWSLTRWQRDLFPTEYRDDFWVLYDGVDTQRFHEGGGRVANSSCPPARRIAGRPVPSGVRVVTFVAGVTDRLRGFDHFVRLANRLQETFPDLLCVAAGSPVVERGLDVQYYGRDYPKDLFRQVSLYDPDRFWLLGFVPPPVIAELLAASDLHVYPSRPYFVSRSLLEAMATGCTVLAWDEEPVREFLQAGQTGLLVNPKDEDAWFHEARVVLQNPAAYRPLGQAAAALVQEHYAQDVTLPVLAKRFSQLV
jgi:glycosyltransferase involved in cell wall biosynthesis